MLFTRTSQKGNVLVVVLLIVAVGVAVIAGGFIFKSLNIKKQPAEKVTPTEKIITLGTAFRLFPSPTGKYTLVLSSLPDQEGCKIEVFDVTGDPVRYLNLPGLLGVETIKCGQVMYGLYSDEFLGWQDDTHLTFQFLGKTIFVITVVDSPNAENGGTVDQFSYDYKSLNFGPLELTTSTSVFACQDMSETRIQDRILFIDLKTDKTIKEFTFDKDTVFYPVYDHINNGYIVAQRFYGEDVVQTKISFLNVRNYTIKKLVDKTVPFTGGRGCGPSRIRSVKLGEVIYDSGGCLALDESDYSSDGYLHLNLL